MPPENKQSFSPDLCARTTAPSLLRSSSRSTSTTQSSSSLPTLFSVLASEPLRQHIAILIKDPSPPTIMHINTPSADKDVTTTTQHTDRTISPSPPLQEEEVDEEEETDREEDEEEEDISHGPSTASSPTTELPTSEIKQEVMRRAVKKERGWSATTMTSTTTATVSAALESGGFSVKQEAHDQPSENHARGTESRPDPQSFSQTTDEEGGADVSFMSEDQGIASQRSELGEHLSADVFGKGLSLNASTPTRKRTFSRTQSDQDMRLRSPSFPPMSPSSQMVTRSTQAAAKYKWKTVTITKEVLVIDLDDSDDDGGGDSGDSQVTAEAAAGGGGSEEVDAETAIVKDENESTSAPSTDTHPTGPSATVLGKRVAISPHLDAEGWSAGGLDDLTAEDRRLSKRPTISGSQTCPMELLDSDSETERSHHDLTFTGLNSESSSSAAARSGSSSGPGSKVSRHGPQAIVVKDTSEPNTRQETQSLSQQIRAYQQHQQQRFMQNQARKGHQQTPIATSPTRTNHQPALARNPQALQPNDANFSSLPHYGYISDDAMEEELPPPYAVRGPQPLQMAYPNHMTSDGYELTDTQLHVLDQVINKRRNVFFTGSAGTGKSVLLRELIIRLRAKHSRWRQNNDDWDALAAGHVAVTASTGIAACNIRGCTIHSFAGIGLGTDPFETLCFKVKNSNVLYNRWKSTAVLVIDEVSMISAELMDLIEKLARFVRNDRRPWGGIQVVLVGDFFQLPPVEKVKHQRFCFVSDAWKSIDTCIQLQKVFRQLDNVFVDALNQIRVGILSPTTISIFGRLDRPIPEDDGIKPTELFPLKKQVEESNAAMLVKLPGKSIFYFARDSKQMANKMEQHCMAPTKLELKVDAQVMLLKNQSGGSTGLVNGSIGIVIEMTTEPATNVRTGKDGKALPSFNKPGELLPKVRFVHDTGGYTDMVLGREEWTVEAPNPRRVRNTNGEEEYTTEVLGRRIQIPLCLAWAMSIHKSQGQTLSKVKVDLGRVFEKGQAYVALSRATCLEGLQVVHFDQRKVMVSQKVVNFYETIGGVPGPS